MELYSQPLDIRWSDLDPNLHLRHSVYYDYGAFCRISFLNSQGLTPTFMVEHSIGPILFREECIFRKEVRLGDALMIDLRLASAAPNFARWTIKHNIIKNDNVLAAVITVDGAWIDIKRRKLATPPEEVFNTFNEMPRTTDFLWSK
ncbi:MAG: thioesterase [Sphingobacteriales bacterium]|nr:MAG: thioesterase [Sphingobacteriales bacterium]